MEFDHQEVPGEIRKQTTNTVPVVAWGVKSGEEMMQRISCASSRQEGKIDIIHEEGKKRGV